jgi:hypothetical protein
MTPSLLLPAVAVLAAALAGCSFNPIGESRFDCNRKENPSEFCRSFKALEKSTNGPLPESRFDQAFRMSDYDRATGIAPGAPAQSDAVPQPSASRLPHQRMAPAADPLAGLPLRRAPVVQRVFIKRFVDDNDSLQDDLVVYREVRGARWTGFEEKTGDARAAGAYPHRAREAAPVETPDAPPAPATNLAQPDSGIDGAAGSALSPAGFQSGGVNVPQAER